MKCLFFWFWFLISSSISLVSGLQILVEQGKDGLTVNQSATVRWQHELSDPPGFDFRFVINEQDVGLAQANIVIDIPIGASGRLEVMFPRPGQYVIKAVSGPGFQVIGSSNQVVVRAAPTITLVPAPKPTPTTPIPSSTVVLSPTPIAGEIQNNARAAILAGVIIGAFLLVVFLVAITIFALRRRRLKEQTKADRLSFHPEQMVQRRSRFASVIPRLVVIRGSIFQGRPSRAESTGSTLPDDLERGIRVGGVITPFPLTEQPQPPMSARTRGISIGLGDATGGTASCDPQLSPGAPQASGTPGSVRSLPRLPQDPPTFTNPFETSVEGGQRTRALPTTPVSALPQSAVPKSATVPHLPSLGVKPPPSPGLPSAIGAPFRSALSARPLPSPRTGSATPQLPSILEHSTSFSSTHSGAGIASTAIPSSPMRPLPVLPPLFFGRSLSDSPPLSAHLESQKQQRLRELPSIPVSSKTPSTPKTARALPKPRTQRQKTLEGRMQQVRDQIAEVEERIRELELEESREHSTMVSRKREWEALTKRKQGVMTVRVGLERHMEWLMNQMESEWAVGATDVLPPGYSRYMRP